MAKMRLTLEADGPGFRLLSDQSNRNRWAATLLHMFMAETKDDFVDYHLPSWDDLGLKNVSITVADDKGYVDRYDTQPDGSNLLHASEILR
ncbi:MAG: hypothetical protein ACLP5H_24665 [Desulfomonilaceae bacterium]